MKLLVRMSLGSIFFLLVFRDLIGLLSLYVGLVGGPGGVKNEIYITSM